MKKRLLVITIAIIVIMGISGNAFAFLQTGLYPEILLDRDLSVPVFTAGSDNTLELILKNYSRFDAKNIKITVDFMELNQYITLYELNSTKVVGDINRYSSKEVDYTFYLSESIKSGIYMIKLTYVVRDELNDMNTTVEEIYVNVENNRAPATIYISNIKAIPEKIAEKDKFRIGVELTNAGDIFAKNMRIEMNGFEKHKFAPVNSTNKAFINRLNGKESLWVYFDVTALEGIESRVCDLIFDISYENPENQKSSIQIPAYLDIAVVKKAVTEEQHLFVPKIIISSYSTSQEVILAGTEFDLSIKFKNTSKVETVNNIKVTLDFGAENIFIPVDSSNTFYIEDIQPDGTVEKSIRLYAKTGASTQFYPIKAVMNYERGKGTDNLQLQESESITVSVKQVARVQVSQLYLPSELPVGMPYGTYFSFYNLGKSTLYNLNIKLEGEGLDGSNSAFFAGNLSSGGFNYYDGTFILMSAGEVNGNIVFEFEDEMGNKDVIKQPFKLTGIEGFNDRDWKEDPYMPEFPPYEEDLSGTGNPYILYGGIGLGVLVALAAIILIVRKSRKKEVE